MRLCFMNKLFFCHNISAIFAFNFKHEACQSFKQLFNKIKLQNTSSFLYLMGKITLQRIAISDGLLFVVKGSRRSVGDSGS